jgi:hypothetical protein
MAKTKPKQAARKNIKKAQTARKTKSRSERPKAQTKGTKRAKPGATGEGEYYHIQIRPTDEFTTFRTQDVGEKGGIERVAGQRSDGSWETQEWLVNKDLAHVEQGRLIPDSQDAQDVLKDLGSTPEHIEGDRFQAKPGTS